MKRTCVFKAKLEGRWYRVYECIHQDYEYRTYYQTYVGRRRLDECTWSCLGSAIGSIIASVDEGILIDLVEVWK